MTHALLRPALGCAAHDPLAVVVAAVLEGRVAWVEVDVVGDRDLGNATLHGERRVDVDRDGAVRRLVGVEVGVEREVAVGGGSPSGGVQSAHGPAPLAQFGDLAFSSPSLTRR